MFPHLDPLLVHQPLKTYPSCCATGSGAATLFHSLDCNLLLIDQRSSGQSEGRYLTFGIRDKYDLQAWLFLLADKLGPEHPLYLDGISMGATTVLMASDMEFPANVRGIIADCGFTSPGDILRYLIEREYHLPARPMAAILNVYACIFAGIDIDEWSTEEALKAARYPVLLTHGTGDTFVPSRMSERAYAACTSEKQLELFPDAGHGVSYLKDTPRYQKALREFLEKYTYDS